MRSRYLRELVDSFDMNRGFSVDNKLKMSLIPVPPSISIDSADIKYMHGRYYFVNGKNHESIEAYIKAIDMYKRLGDPVGEAYACIYCAMNYREIRNFSESRKLNRRAYDIGVKISDSYIMLFSILMSIITYSYEGMQEESDRLMINTERMVREVGHPKLTGDYYNNAAHAALQTGKYEEALERLSIAYESYLSHYGTKNVTNVLIVQSNQASALVGLGRVDEALVILDDIETTVRDERDDIFLMEVIRSRIDAMRVRGDFRTAYLETQRLVDFYARWMKSLIRHPRAEVDMMRDDLEDFEKKLSKMNEELTAKNHLLDKHTRNNELVREIGARLTAALDVKQITQVIASGLEKIMSYSFVSIALIEGDSLVVRYVVAKNDDLRIELPQYLPLGNTDFIMTSAIARDEDLLIKERREFTKYIFVDKFNVQGQERRFIESAVYCRLRHGDEVIGLFTVQDYEQRSYGELEFETIREIASFVAISLLNLQKNDQVRAKTEMLEAISLQDSLTELGNRRAFNVRFDRLLNGGDSFALIFVDMNHLKVINDTAGHAAGDAYLRAASSILSRECAGCSVYRLSGDEFVVLAPALAESEVELMAENIKRSCQNQHLGEYPLAVSIGYAFSSEEQGDDILRSAESRMYADKAMYYATGGIRRNTNDTIKKK